ncbi:hypothetical protein AAG906_018769 [Vitis piasezkii]
MALQKKYVGFLVLLVVLGITGFKGVDAAESCPSKSCCLQVKKIGQNPDCLCAVMLSNTAKSSGIKPEVAVTIPKRCNLADRPVGYKCGAYTLP